MKYTLKLIVTLNLLSCFNTYTAEAAPAAAETNHYLLEQKNLNKLYDLAELFIKKFDEIHQSDGQNQIILILGQSPAYVGEMMKRIDEINGDEYREYINVAFSSGNALGHLEYYDSKMISTYEKYFKSLIAMHRTDGVYYIIDLCHEGRSIKRFKNMLKAIIPYEDMKMIFTKHFFLEKEDAFSKQEINFGYNALSKQEIDFGCIEIKDKKLKELIVQLGNSDKLNDRLVPCFPHFKWTEIDPFDFEPSQTALAICKAIEEFTPSI